MNKEYNNYELISLSQEQNEDAIEKISNIYKPVIKKLSIKYYKLVKTGIDLKDIEQECYLSFLEALDNYNEFKNIHFSTYAISCMKNRLISIIRQANREKHIYLNEAISLDEILNDEYTISYYIKDETYNPEHITIEEEEYNTIYNETIKNLTPLEECVITLKIQDYNYNEIASILDKSRKSIDSCMQRIKNKLKNK